MEMEMEMKPRKCIYNNATRWIQASRKNNGISCSRMTLISFNLFDGMESFPEQKKILSSFWPSITEILRESISFASLCACVCVCVNGEIGPISVILGMQWNELRWKTNQFQFLNIN